MLDLIFPATADNKFRGYRAALWLLGAVLAVRALQGVQCIVNAQDTATRADGIPVASFEPAAQATVVLLFALSGVAFVLLALFGAVIVIRYRALTAFMYLLLLADYALRKTIVVAYPTERAGDVHVGAIPIGALVNYTLLAVMFGGLVLALMRRRET